MKTYKIKPAYSYVIGYVLALMLTVNAYAAATLHVGTMTSSLLWILVTLAAVQIIVHAVYFLHMGREGKPYWQTLSFAITITVLLFIVIGSIWVMNNLDYNMMTPAAQHTMMNDEGIPRE